MPQKVITSDEMGRLESLSEKFGTSPKELMGYAGRRIASFTLSFLEENDLEKKVYLLVGKGNNGGDALTAGTYLLEKGIEVVGILADSEESHSRIASEAKTDFLSQGGRLYPFNLVRKDQNPTGIFLDGIFGTGFKGALKGVYQEMILFANRTGLPILSIDIASGIGGEGVPIEASVTLSLGFPKVPSYLGEGWDYSGHMQTLPIGLPEEVVHGARPQFLSLEKGDLPQFLPKIFRSRHKYERGFVAIIAGSPGMTGSAYLASLGAFRGGAGIVHLYTEEGLDDAFSALPQLIVKPIDQLEKIERYDAVVVGPGLLPTRDDIFEEVFSQAKKLVIDGEALNAIAKLGLTPPSESILTPHHGELERLLGRRYPQRTLEWFDDSKAWAEEHRVALLAKGGPTFLFGGTPYVIPFGDPGMATAGSGDLLSGILGALLAQGLSSEHSALLGASIHGLAGEIAAELVTSYCMHAGDIAECIPEIFNLLLRH
jgi:NAD(P)H-hydrate epimerase